VKETERHGVMQPSL